MPATLPLFTEGTLSRQVSKDVGELSKIIITYTEHPRHLMLHIEDIGISKLPMTSRSPRSVLSVTSNPKKEFQHRDTGITKDKMEIRNAGIATHSRKHLSQDVLSSSNTNLTELTQRRETELPVSSLLTWNVNNPSSRRDPTTSGACHCRLDAILHV